MHFNKKRYGTCYTEGLDLIHSRIRETILGKQFTQVFNKITAPFFIIISFAPPLK